MGECSTQELFEPRPGQALAGVDQGTRPRPAQLVPYGAGRLRREDPGVAVERMACRVFREWKNRALLVADCAGVTVEHGRDLVEDVAIPRFEQLGERLYLEDRIDRRSHREPHVVAAARL